MVERASQELVIKVTVDKKTGELKVADAELDKFAQTAKQAEDETKKLTLSWKDLLNIAGLSGVAFTSVQEGLQFIVNTMREGLRQASEDIKVNKELAFTLETFGENVNEIIPGLENWFKQAQKLTKFSDTDMKRALIELIRYTGNYSEANKILRVAMNYATKSGQDLVNVTEVLGYAILTGDIKTRAMQRTFGHLVTEAKDLNDFLNKLNETTKGYAVTTDDYTVRVAKLQHRWQDALKGIGFAITSIAVPIFNFIDSILEGFDKILIKMREVLNVQFSSIVNDERVRRNWDEQWKKIEQRSKKGSDKVVNDIVTMLDKINVDLPEIEKRTEEVFSNIDAVIERTAIKTKLLNDNIIELGKTSQKTANLFGLNMQNAFEKALDSMNETQKTTEEFHRELERLVKEAAEESNKEMEELKKRTEETAKVIGDTIAGVFTDMIFHAKSFEDAVKHMADEIIAQLIRIAAQQAALAILGIPPVGPTGISSILGFQQGGYVSKTGLYVVHGGEYVIPRQGEYKSPNTTRPAMPDVNILMKQMAEEIRRQTPIAMTFATRAYRLGNKRSSIAL